MKKNLNVTRFRRMYMGALALVPAVLAPAESAALSDAAALGQDVAEFFRPSKDDDNGYED